MHSLAPLLLAAGPLAFGAVALVAKFRLLDTRALYRLASLAACLAGLAALASAACLVVLGPSTSLHIGSEHFAPRLRLDALSVTMAALVSVLGAVIVRFTRSYFSGSPDQAIQLAKLCSVLSSVLAMTSAGDVVTLLVFWIGTSLTLDSLLVHHKDRAVALRGAAKKFVLARAGDVCLALAFALLAARFGTTEITVLTDRVREVGPTGATTAAAALVAAAAVLKSAQVPFSGWLVDLVDAPTPTSALLHAGVLNGGVFLLLRLSWLVAPAPGVLAALVLVGGLTAATMSIAMMAQPAVKTGLAYSSAAHMGYTMLLIGLGAPTCALLHLVAHSIYKAHAFLSSAELARRASRHASPPPLVAFLAVAVGTASFLFVGKLTGMWDGSLTHAIRGGIFALGMAPLVARKDGEHAAVPWIRAVTAPAAVACLLAAMERFGSLGLVGTFAVSAASFPVDAASVIAFVVLGAASFLSSQRGTSPSALYRAVWVHARNGFYFSILFDRSFDIGRSRFARALPLRHVQGKPSL